MDRRSMSPRPTHFSCRRSARWWRYLATTAKLLRRPPSAHHTRALAQTASRGSTITWHLRFCATASRTPPVSQQPRACPAAGRGRQGSSASSSPSGWNSEQHCSFRTSEYNKVRCVKKRCIWPSRRYPSFCGTGDENKKHGLKCYVLI